MTAGLFMMLTAVLVGIACYNFICAGADVPTGQTSKMMMLAGRRSGTRKELLGDVYIAKIADVKLLKGLNVVKSVLIKSLVK